MSQVGVEPTMFRMSRSYSPLSSPLDILAHINTVFELVRLTHSCARNADLTSSGHAVWPSLLHRPLIRSVTTSLFLMVVPAWIEQAHTELQSAALPTELQNHNWPTCHETLMVYAHFQISLATFGLGEAGLAPCTQGTTPALLVKLFSHINGRYCYAPALALTIYQPCGKRRGLCNRPTNLCPWILKTFDLYSLLFDRW